MRFFVFAIPDYTDHRDASAFSMDERSLRCVSATQLEVYPDGANAAAAQLDDSSFITSTSGAWGSSASAAT